MRQKAAPGVQVSAGRLRVDAARAIAKLREYQLEEQTGWVLEAVRAAVAAGATRVHVQGDSNDVWLRWEGEPWPAETLPRLFDELVSPEVSGDRQEVRLLAMAVNSALGLSPAYVDVYSVESEGKAVRARYTPEVLIPPAEELGEAPLHRLSVEPAPAPLRTRRGMLVHLRRKLGLKVLAYFLREEPRELQLVREACRDLAVPLLVGKDELGRHLLQRDLVRVPLGEDLDGFLAVTEAPPPGEAGPGGQLEIAERGVVLVREAWLLELRHMAGAPRLPLRLLVDARQMPTNAARSQVRKDGHPLPAALRRAGHLLAELIGELVERLTAAATTTTTTTTATATAAASGEHGLAALAKLDGRARAAALAIIGGSGARWSWRLAPALMALEKVPLVCDATGRLRPVSRLWRPFVYDGRAPLPDELAPWLGDVLWIPPGDVSGVLVPAEHYDAPALREHLRWARKQLAAKRDFYAMPASEPRIPAEAKVRLSASLDAKLAGSCVPDELFGALRGKACVLSEGGSLLYLFLHGRLIEQIPYRCAIPFAVAIDAAFTPIDSYRGVVRDAQFEQAERAMFGAVIRAMEVLERGELGQPVPDGFTPMLSVEREEHARTVRAAAGLAMEARLELVGSLHNAKAWRSLDGEWLSLAELASSPDKAIGTAPRQKKQMAPAAPRGRLVLEALEREHEELVSLLRGKHVIRYEAAKLGRGQTAQELAKRMIREGRSFALAIEAPRAAIALGPAMESRLRVLHCGVLLEDRNYTDDVGRFDVMVENDEAIPDDDWERAAVSAVWREDVVEWKLAAVRALAGALVGKRPEHLAIAGTGDLLPELALVLTEALVSRTPAQLFGAELLAELRQAPLFTVTGQAEKWSAIRLASEMPGELRHLALSRGQELRALHRRLAGAVAGGDLALIEEAMGEMTVLLAEPKVAELAMKLSGHLRLTAVDGELARLVQSGKRERRRWAHLQKEPQAKFEDGELHVEVEVPGGGERLRCWIALARPVPGAKVADLRTAADRATGMAMSFFVEQRLLKQIDLRASLPLHAALEVSEELIDEGYDGLPAELMNELLRHIERAVPRLLVAVAEARPDELTLAGSARSLFLRAARDKILSDDTLARLQRAVSFATVQGPRVTLAELSRQLSICNWQGEWLAGEDASAASEAPILLVPPADYELRNLLEALHDGWISDVSESVARLQGRRRHALGLVPRPAVLGAQPELTRKLEELGELGKALAPGEMALVDEPSSTLLLHVQGELRERLELPEVLPVVKLALEDTSQREPADHSQVDPSLSLSGALGRLDDEQQELAAQAQKLALALVLQIAEASPIDELPAWVQRSLRLAVLTRRLVVPLMEAPLFRTASGEPIAWCEVVEQLELFDSVWALDEDEPLESEPLDPRRIVLRMTASERELARQNGRPVVEASRQLALDAQVREDLAKRRKPELRLPPGLPLLATEALDGDGVTAPRGLVGVLAVRAAGERKLCPHREMLELAELGDECSWPTVAVVDDARLAVDRQMERALPGPALDELRAAVEAASARALARAVRIPDDALASRRVVARPVSFRSGRGTMHGALWIREAPSALFEEAADTVLIREGKLERAWERASQLGLIGELHIHAPPGDAAQSQRVDEAVAEVCREVHRELVKEFLRQPDVDRDVLTAHVAMAAARGDSFAGVPEAERVRFPCFGPQPLTIAELTLMFRHLRRVQVGATEYEAKQGVPFIFDDQSRTARVLLPLVGRLTQAQLKALQARGVKVPPPPKPAAEKGEEGEEGEGQREGEAARAATNGANAANANGASSANIAANGAANGTAPAAISTSASRDQPDAPAPRPTPATTPATAPGTAPAPPHPLQALLVLTADRLVATGIAHHPIHIAIGATSPMVTVASGHLTFAGNHPTLRALAAACSANTAWHADAIDALVAHLLCLLHAASGGSWLDVNDATEQRALGRLLATAPI